MSGAPVVHVSRRAEFSAAHHLRIAGDPDASRALFGAMADPAGHGHNYEVTVTVAAPIDATTGFGLNVADLKALLTDVVVSRLDGANLVEAIAELGALPATCEALAVVIWRWLSPRAPSLRAVRVAEHPRLWAEYRGE